MRCETKDVRPSSYEYTGVQCRSTNFKFVIQVIIAWLYDLSSLASVKVVFLVHNCVKTAP